MKITVEQYSMLVDAGVCQPEEMLSVACDAWPAPQSSTVQSAWDAVSDPQIRLYMPYFHCLGGGRYRGCVMLFHAMSQAQPEGVTGHI